MTIETPATDTQITSIAATPFIVPAAHSRIAQGPIEAHVLLAQLIQKHQAVWVDPINVSEWLAAQANNAAQNHVLLFAGDPIRFPEGLDVAVVLPELRQACKGAGLDFSIAVAVPLTAEVLAKKYGSQRWPTLMFFRGGQYVTTVSGMHDWVDFVNLVRTALQAPISRAPTIGIPVVRADAASNADSHCH